MWASTLLDAAMHREWPFRLGRLGVLGRVAHFFAETNARLQPIGLSDGTAYDLPITQTDLSESTGLTSIHVNRVLRSLRESRTCVFQSSCVEIQDRGQLEHIGQFDPTYLYLKPPAADRASEPTKKVRRWIMITLEQPAHSRKAGPSPKTAPCCSTVRTASPSR